MLRIVPAMIALTTVEWAQVIAPGLAALAAGAAWFSALTARRSLELARLPWLTGIWTNRADDSTGVNLVIYNAGAGAAHDASVRVVSAGSISRREITDTGVLEPGDRANLRIDELPGHYDRSTPQGILVCRDWAGRWHVWSWDGRHKRPRTWRGASPQSLSATKMLEKMYPKLDAGALKGVDRRLIGPS